MAKALNILPFMCVFDIIYKGKSTPNTIFNERFAAENVHEIKWSGQRQKETLIKQCISCTQEGENEDHRQHQQYS